MFSFIYAYFAGDSALEISDDRAKIIATQCKRPYSDSKELRDDFKILIVK
jgi:hypothetical protein